MSNLNTILSNLLVQVFLVNIGFACVYISSEHLDCSYNSLLSLPVFTVEFKTVNASHNRISNLNESAFHVSRNITHEDNNLKLSHLVSRQRNQLEIIDLSWNSITCIHPNSFAFASRLKWLSLANNRGLQLPKDGLFVIGNSLEHLYLNNCNISDLGKHMFKPGNHNLKELYLAHNVIMFIHGKSFIYFEMLQVLDLSYNKLMSIEVKTLVPLINLQSLLLENNPLLCDCSTHEFCTWTVEQDIVTGNVTCGISENHIVPWTEISDVKCGMKLLRNRRQTADSTVSDKGGSEQNSHVILIIICVVVAVLVMVFICACLLNNSHECMEAAGCLLVCQHCYQ